MHGTGIGQAQRALLGTIDDGLSAVGQAQDDLDKKVQLPPLGDDAVSITTNELSVIVSITKKIGKGYLKGDPLP